MSSHENITEYKAVKTASNRNFGLTFACVFLIIFAYNALRYSIISWWLLGASGIFLITTLFFPKVHTPFNFLWTRLGLFLGKVTTPIVMGVIYFSVFSCLGILFRVFKRDGLKIKIDKNATTYWNKRQIEGFSSESFKNQF